MDTHILIINDNQTLGGSIEALIKETGYQCTCVSDAAEALELLKEKQFDVVITDEEIPGMNGLDLSDRIKQDYDTDVIVMANYGGDDSYEAMIYTKTSDFVFKPVRLEELLLRIKRVINEQQLSKERTETLEELKKLAITDGLTELYNSRHFFGQLEIEVDRANRYNHPLSLLLLDIDHLKPFNDTYGHLEGDKVLKKIGMIIRSCLRKMDSAYRYGGDEFTIILPATRGAEAMFVAERIRTTIEEAEFSPDPEKMVNLTISIGATEYIHDEKLSTFVRRADQIMYVSKERGGNSISSTLPNEA
ncbi:diguanylate cyclase [Thermodesulfobacteriota bacterium]